MSSTGWSSEPRVPGQRRQKVFGYIKAANELRQSYQSQLHERWRTDDYDGGMPGAFPDADIVRSGDEEMLLFPSYARRHTRLMHLTRDVDGNLPGTRDLSQSETGDAEYWRREWQRYEDENAVVDVDVRGWIYSPQKGPLNRRNRLILAVARKLSGIPAPEASPVQSRESSRPPSLRERAHEDVVSHEEEAAAREADMLTRRGQREAEAASKGSYSADTSSLIDFSPVNSRASSPTRPSTSRVTTAPELNLHATNDQNLSAQSNRQSWSNTAQMSRDEIIAANEQLISRLKPFMTLPLANAPITIFFYNDNKSQSKVVYTDESGHFKVRAALDFVPHTVRVLASENLSATEDVVVTNPVGITLISDIDDTIKHSAIASGAKEIFKNTFIKELGALTIPGVREWYGRMASMGVKMHYVSNSPWQLYPLLKTYFKLAGLPSGSFHLKQYSGMLQGIFEPAAERKKGSLDRIMQDFPERKFILVGDSGEADLEVYTDIVMENPNKILGVFIRDVTTPLESNLDSPQSARPGYSRQSSQASVKDDAPDTRPALPSRPKPTPSSDGWGSLIDFSEEQPSSVSMAKSSSSGIEQLHSPVHQPPNKPAKPSNLRSSATIGSQSNGNKSSEAVTQQSMQIKKQPPPPPAPRRVGTGVSASNNTDHDDHLAYGNLPAAQAPRPTRPQTDRTTTSASTGTTSTGDEGYLASARHQLSNAYNALPSIRTQSPSRAPGSDAVPQLPARKGITSVPAAAARWATGATGGDPNAGGDGGAPGQPFDRKLDTWRRRWARSEDIMRRRGVVLLTWRVGSDVEKVAAGLVQKAQREYDEKK